MDHKTHQGYEAPRVVDYGDLQELTAACLGGSGGDAGYGSHVGGYSVGPSNPAAECKSKP
ncbi:MAG TPA: lasso RiPP family leader peptide-containing protein [Solirubrobacterales bacterium]|nr:lasso RiPP family leader peptide-containing protein [Solirubrobacterales bacterium]